MELALNFFWLLLILPAGWIYRRQILSGAYPPVRSGRFGSLLILACILVLLFPVVSATDDLHTVGFEMEERGAQKWTKQLAGDRTCPIFKSGPVLAQSALLTSSRRNERVLGHIWVAPITLAAWTAVFELASRAPPLAHLG